MFKKPDGSRFDSQIRAKPHLRPRKTDEPGPGDYQLPSSIRTDRRHALSAQRTTFGASARDARERMNQTARFPGPGAYDQLFPRPPQDRAFGNDGYSFPKNDRSKSFC